MSVGMDYIQIRQRWLPERLAEVGGGWKRCVSRRVRRRLKSEKLYYEACDAAAISRNLPDADRTAMDLYTVA